MTTVLLIRHATCDPVGRRLAGRAPGVSLNTAGREQADRLAAWLLPVPLSAIYSSPLARARETAARVAEGRGAAVVPHEGFLELDFGAWTGEAIEALDALPADSLWRRFNAFRGGTRAPGGELMLEAQARAVGALLAIAEAHHAETVAVVSHADVIKGIVAHFLGVPLDLAHRLEVSTASVSALRVHAWGAQLLALNGGPDRPALGVA